jgi:hypothetical protein
MEHKMKDPMEDVFLLYPPVDDMGRRELEDFIDDLDLDLDPSDYRSLKKLRLAVLEMLGLV